MIKASIVNCITEYERYYRNDASLSSKHQIKTETLKGIHTKYITKIAQQTENYEHYMQDSHRSSSTRLQLQIKEKVPFLFC